MVGALPPPEDVPHAGMLLSKASFSLTGNSL